MPSVLPPLSHNFSTDTAPTPPHYNRKILFMIILMVAALSFFYEVFLDTPFYEGEKTVVIFQGTGANQIGTLLKENGVIRSRLFFLFVAGVEGNSNKLKAGTYKFPPMPLTRIITALAKGGEELTITVPEGWNNDEIGTMLEKKGLTAKKQFRMLAEAGGLFVDSFPVLRDKPLRAGLEGYLFPDTYRILAGTKPEDIIRTMLENFSKKMTSELQNAVEGQKKTIFEIITMASLIEKEVVSDEDRRIVSGILWKRIDWGIPLQVDASVIYSKARLSGFSASEDSRTPRITQRETLIDSPYNTYRNHGLPPGPIVNPGISAILAAIFPKESPYIYYLSTPDGRTIFSSTLEEHNEAKRKYLK